MSCSSNDLKYDLKAYLLGEMPQAEKSSVEDHVRACRSCREELDRLQAHPDPHCCRWKTKRSRSGSRSFPTKSSSRAGGKASGARVRRWVLRRRWCWRRRFWCTGFLLIGLRARWS